MAPEPPASGAAGKQLLPVTVLSGFLGAGKTTLLKHILRSAGRGDREGGDTGTGGEPGQAALRVAVIVNDMGEVNLDASEIKNSRLIQEEAAMVELHNGCICCTLRGDLLKTVRALSEEKEFDYLVIESTGISEPLPVAQTFVMNVGDATLEVPASAKQLEKQGGQDASEAKEGRSSPAQQEQQPDKQEEADKRGEGKQGGAGAAAAQAPPKEWRSLSHFARLDTMVTVVDALNIYDVLGSLETLAERNVAGMVGNSGMKGDAAGTRGDAAPDGTGSDVTRSGDEHEGHGHAHSSGDEHEGHGHAQSEQPSDDRSIAQLMLDQIEFADVILLSKANLLAEQPGKGVPAVKEIRRLLKKLNPGSKVIVPAEKFFADVPLKTVINTKLFDMRKAQVSPGWLRELIKSTTGGPGHKPETEEYGISSVVFRTRARPFHPGRLQNVLSSFGDYASSVAKGGAYVAASAPLASTFSGVVRAKGQLWVATCNDRPVHLHAAGRHVKLEPGGATYLAAVPRTKWGEPQMARFLQLVSQRAWHKDNGDREVEMVLIGVGMDKEKVRNELRAALLTDAEMAGGPASWQALEDVLFGGRFQ